MGWLVYIGTGQGSHPASLLSMLPIVGGYAGNLQTIPYGVQDMQVVGVCLKRTHGVLEGDLLHGLQHCCNDSVVCAQSIGHTLGPGHPQQGILSNVGLPCSIIQLKTIIGKAGHPTMAHDIQLCCC